MKIHYTKHQRDYTVLGTSVVFCEFCSKRMEKYFSYSPSPMLILVKDNILYHYIADDDGQKRAKSWLKKYSKQQLLDYYYRQKKVLVNYRKFLKKDHKDIFRALNILHNFMTNFLRIIMVAIEVPEYNDNIDKGLLDLCFIIRKDFDDIYKIGMDFQNDLLKKLEKQFNICSHTLANLTLDEFKQFNKCGILPNNIKKRSKFLLVEHSTKGAKIYLESEAKNKLKEIDIDLPNLKFSQLKGQVVYPGKVNGMVKIVKLINDADKLNKNDILVTSMTDPRYLPIMKKAAAIITDEGGITCHAAIVSRELKIPCIVGIKIATKILRDEDLVEVDDN